MQDFIYHMTILILISKLSMVVFLVLLPMESISLNSVVLLEHLAIVDFNTRNKLLTKKLLKQGYRYHKNFAKHFLNYIDDIMI